MTQFGRIGRFFMVALMPLSLGLLTPALVNKAQANVVRRVASGDTGLYYSTPTSTDNYQPSDEDVRGKAALRADAAMRETFFNGLNDVNSNPNLFGGFTIILTGEANERLIFVGQQDNYLSTPFRARAFIKAMGRMARGQAVLQSQGDVQKLDLSAMAFRLGFTSVTISNGGNFSHHVNLAVR